MLASTSGVKATLEQQRSELPSRWRHLRCRSGVAMLEVEIPPSQERLLAVMHRIRRLRKAIWCETQQGLCDGRLSPPSLAASSRWGTRNACAGRFAPLRQWKESEGRSDGCAGCKRGKSAVLTRLTGRRGRILNPQPSITVKNVPLFASFEKSAYENLQAISRYFDKAQKRGPKLCKAFSSGALEMVVNPGRALLERHLARTASDSKWCPPVVCSFPNCWKTVRRTWLEGAPRDDRSGIVTNPELPQAHVSVECCIVLRGGHELAREPPLFWQCSWACGLRETDEGGPRGKRWLHLSAPLGNRGAQAHRAVAALGSRIRCTASKRCGSVDTPILVTLWVGRRYG